jgi:hypothetical protein
MKAVLKRAALGHWRCFLGHQQVLLAQWTGWFFKRAASIPEGGLESNRQCPKRGNENVTRAEQRAQELGRCKRRRRYSTATKIRPGMGFQVFACRGKMTPIKLPM